MLSDYVDGGIWRGLLTVALRPEAMPKMSAAVDGMACTWDAGAEDAGGGRSPGPSGGEPKMGTYMMPIVKKDRSHASACGPRSPRVRGGGP